MQKPVPEQSKRTPSQNQIVFFISGTELASDFILRPSQSQGERIKPQEWQHRDAL
jgi:hypothetical protein